nr:ribonuclease H-like domain-containing protein [Tanacetum cinerariifolium]
MTDYSLWEVILNGDSPPPTRIVDGAVQIVSPTTVEQRLAKKNKLNARGTLLMALPDKHQLKFNIYKDAKSLIEAIEKRFRVTAAPSISVASSKAIVSTLPNIDSLSDAVIYSFFASQSNSPQLDNEVLKQIDPDDLEEIDIKWQMAMLTMRARRFLKRTKRNLGANETDTIGFDMSKVKCYNCHRRGHFARECRTPRDNRNKETTRRTVPTKVSNSNALVSQCDVVGGYDWSFQADEEPTNYALMAYTSSGSSSSSGSDNKSQLDVLSYKTGLESVEARLVVYQKNENVFEEDIKLLKLDVMLRDNALAELRKKFEKTKKERNDLKLTLDKFQTSSKNLSKLLESQVSDKTGLGFDSQVFHCQVLECEELHSHESDNKVPKNAENERYKTGKGYHAVPPPYTRTFIPPKLDLVFTDDPSASESVANVFNVESSTNKPSQDMSKTLRSDAPIVKDWISDSEDKTEIESVPKQREPSFVKSTEHVNSFRDSVKKVKHNKKSKNLRINNQKSRVWMTYPNSNRNVFPTTFLTRSRLVSLNAARPVPTAVTQSTVKSPRLVKHIQVNSGLDPQKKLSFLFEVQGNPHQALKDKGVIDSGCSRHMTGNISFLSDFNEINGGYVAFGWNPKGDTECVVLSSDYKLPDENHVLLRAPRENNMYNVDLKNVVPSGGLTCLFVNATLDESNLWHRRLGHINFKTMNKLVKGNLVRCLPSKSFENNHTCVACQKGKQHKASCKSKPVYQPTITKVTYGFVWTNLCKEP